VPKSKTNVRINIIPSVISIGIVIVSGSSAPVTEEKKERMKIAKQQQKQNN